MIQTKMRRRNISTECPICGETMRNPGYGKQNVHCCGQYRFWYKTYTETTTYDDGRDERGRYHHAPHIVKVEEEVDDWNDPAR